MGTWGTGIFSDDIACDVRDDYRDYVANGLSGPEATNKLLTEYKDCLNDQDEMSVFWIALALTQSKCGRLEDRVKNKAFEIIDSGIDLKKWEASPKLIKQRIAILNKVRGQLGSPQRLPVKLKKRFINQSPFEIGDAFSYKLSSGNHVIFRVVHIHSDKGGTTPIAEMCNWIGTDIPSRIQIQSFPARKPVETWRAELFLLFEMKKNDFPKNRVNLVGHGFLVIEGKRACVGTPWTYLDSMLKQWFGIE